MTEPHHTQDYSNASLSADLSRSIIALRDYKTRVLQRITLQDQNPETVQLARAELARHGEIIRGHLNRTPEEVSLLNQDISSSLRALLETLDSELANAGTKKYELRVQLLNWIEKMYFQIPLTPHNEHIQALEQNNPYI